MELKRCFVAVFLPIIAVKEIRKIQEAVKKKNFFIGKFTELENLHLTLKFLGEIDEEKIKNVRERLNKIRSSSFETSLGEVGVFSKRFMKILWVKLEGANKLQKQVDEALSDLFVKEERFMSHITIARIKNVYDRKEFIDYLKSLKCKKISFKVSSFYLMESELKPEGPVYSEIERYNLES